MACMTHECLDCNWMDFDNSGGPGTCPKCGGHSILHTYDEPPEPPYRPRDDEEEEE